LFFFQAEDGIRVFHVTGVQTCALPILTTVPPPSTSRLASYRASGWLTLPGSAFTVWRRWAYSTSNAQGCARTSGPISSIHTGASPPQAVWRPLHGWRADRPSRIVGLACRTVPTYPD